MFSRYRSYTSYSEENGKLVPCKEPDESEAKFIINEKLVLVEAKTGKILLEEYQKKLKSEADKPKTCTTS
jgi:hypothetical protein